MYESLKRLESLNSFAIDPSGIFVIVVVVIAIDSDVLEYSLKMSCP